MQASAGHSPKTQSAEQPDVPDSTDGQVASASSALQSNNNVNTLVTRSPLVKDEQSVTDTQADLPVGQKTMKRKAARKSDGGAITSKSAKRPRANVALEDAPEPSASAPTGRRRSTKLANYAELSDDEGHPSPDSDRSMQDDYDEPPSIRAGAAMKARKKSKSTSKSLNGSQTKETKTHSRKPLRLSKSMPNLKKDAHIGSLPELPHQLASSSKVFGDLAPQDPAAGEWSEPTERLVWAFIPVPLEESAATSASTSSEGSPRGFWWAAELEWDEEEDISISPLRARLFVDPNEEVLRFTQPTVDLEPPSQHNVLSFKRELGGSRCTAENFRRNWTSPLPDGADQASTLSGPSDEAFKSSRRAAYERDTELNGGLPDPAFVADSVHASPVKKKDAALSDVELTPKARSKTQKWYPTGTPVDEEVDMRIQEGQLGLARIQWNRSDQWYPAKLVRYDLPKPISKGGEYRHEDALKVTWHVCLPFGDSKGTKKVAWRDFVPIWDNKFFKTPMTEFTTVPNTSVKNVLKRLKAKLPILETVIKGEEPTTVDAHRKFLHSTTFQREQALGDLRHKGEWHETLLDAINEYLGKWCCREDVGRSVEPRGPGDDDFEKLNPASLRLYTELVLEPMTLRLLTLEEEPEMLEKAQSLHPNDSLAATKEAHRLAEEKLKETGWVTAVTDKWKASRGAKLVNQATTEWRATLEAEKEHSMDEDGS